MRTTTEATWPDFISTWEGRVPFLYLDTQKLATFGLGIMVDTGSGMTAFGLSQPWRDKNDHRVSDATIRAEYDRIHAREDLAPKGGFAFRTVATLRLDDAAIDRTLQQKTDESWGQLRSVLPELEGWPADAQLALANMAWNLGPRFLGPRWPNFTRAAKAGDFAKCAVHCLRAVQAKRDFRNRLLFLTAAAVVGVDGNRDKLSNFAGLSAATLRGTAPDQRNRVAWITQLMLRVTGDYEKVLDGKFGPISNRALDAFADRAGISREIDQPLIKRLARAADLRVPVVACRPRPQRR